MTEIGNPVCYAENERANLPSDLNISSERRHVHTQLSAVASGKHNA